MDTKTACDVIRATENSEVAALVLLDVALQKVLAAWPLVRRVDLPVSHESADFERIWSAVEFDEREAVELSGLPSGPGLAAFRRAKGLRLIYPDGSVHRMAAAVLRKMLKDALSSGGRAK